MAMTSCPSCQAEISTEAAACPKCGHQFKSAGGINLRDPVHQIGVIVAGVLLLGAIIYGISLYVEAGH
jgi:uncharacterized paraquat-inducible protein A